MISDSLEFCMEKLQRNLSRKGSLRGTSEKRMCGSPTSNERDGSLISVATSSPKG